MAKPTNPESIEDLVEWAYRRGSALRRNGRFSTDPAWRHAARAEWDRTERAMFPTRHIRGWDVEVTNDDNDGEAAPGWWRNGEAIRSRPGRLRVGQRVPAGNRVRRLGTPTWSVAGVLADDRVLVTSSDARAHVQMLCASGHHPALDPARPPAGTSPSKRPSTRSLDTWPTSSASRTGE